MRIYKIAAMIMIAWACITVHISPAQASSGTVHANATMILMTGDTDFGGCMVRLDKPADSVLSSCPSPWISFSCTGDFNAKDQAYKMLDLVQMSIALKTKVYVKFTDAQKHNGWCVAKRIDF